MRLAHTFVPVLWLIEPAVALAGEQPPCQLGRVLRLLLQSGPEFLRSRAGLDHGGYGWRRQTGGSGVAVPLVARVANRTPHRQVATNSDGYRAGQTDFQEGQARAVERR